MPNSESLDVNTWVERYGGAWEDRDDEAAARLFTPDATYRAHPFEQPHVGREAIRAYWRRATQRQSDLHVAMGRPVVEGDRVAVEWWTTMLRDGEGTTLPGCLLLHFGADGLCTSLREYWHIEPRRLDPHDGWGN